jgi:hypothetical protein
MHERGSGTPTAAGRVVVRSGVGSNPRRPTPVSAHDSRVNDSEVGRTEATLTEAVTIDKGADSKRNGLQGWKASARNSGRSREARRTRLGQG